MANRLRALQEGDVKVRDGGSTDLSLFDEPRHLAPGLFDRHAGLVGPVKLIEVNSLDTQTCERRLDLTSNRRGPEVALGLVERPGEIANHAALGEDERPLRCRNLPEGAANNLFRMPKAVDRRCVDPIHAAIDRSEEHTSELQS